MMDLIFKIFFNEKENIYCGFNSISSKEESDEDLDVDVNDSDSLDEQSLAVAIKGDNVNNEINNMITDLYKMNSKRPSSSANLQNPTQSTSSSTTSTNASSLNNKRVQFNLSETAKKSDFGSLNGSKKRKTNTVVDSSPTKTNESTNNKNYAKKCTYFFFSVRLSKIR